MVEVRESNKSESGQITNQNVKEVCRDCFASESERIAETGEKFLDYFAMHASSDGVLFKTIKEITNDIEIPHQSLSKVLKVLEDRRIIYRRNGIIGLWKE